MSAIQHLLQRWGFVKLGRFGLVLTPEGRILSTRPAVLDDGTGSPIVGWQDGDLAAAELQRWEPARPSPPVAARTSSSAPAATPATLPPLPARSTAAGAPAPEPPTRTAPPAPARPMAIENLVIPEASILAQATPQGSASVMTARVTTEPTVDEDDWEWTIALARARAAAEDATPAAPQRPAAPPPQHKPRAQVVEPAPAARIATRPMAAIAVKDPAASGEWPKTELIGAIDYEDYSRVPTRPAMAIPSVARAPSPSPPAPSTVIPVPALPTMHGTAHASRLEPVVRAPGEVPPASLRRFGKGTGPVEPSAAMSEDTIPNLSIGDRTRPGIGLPAAARAVELPSVKRRMAARD